MSAIARAERLAWNTVARWLEAGWGGGVATLTTAEPPALSPLSCKADEIRSFTGGKTQPTWVFAAIEVGSRLWTSTVVGRRSYRNTLALVLRRRDAHDVHHMSHDRDRWLRVLRDSHPSGLRPGGPLCAGDQDPTP